MLQTRDQATRFHEDIVWLPQRRDAAEDVRLYVEEALSRMGRRNSNVWLTELIRSIG